MSIFDTYSDPYLEFLRQEANRLDEHASNQFFLRLFSGHIFSEREWLVGTEVPPRDHHSQLRMDLAVRCLQHYPSGQKVLNFRLIGQGKKGRAGPAKIREVEVQAYQLCQAHMIESKVSSVWAITYFGSKARLWACLQHDSGWLEAFYPREGDAGDRDAYKDIREYEAAFIWAFGHIKAIPVPDSDTIDKIYDGVNKSYSAAAQTYAVPGSSTQAYGLADSSMEVGTVSTSAEPYTVQGSEYNSVSITKAPGDWTTCKFKDGKSIDVRRDKWHQAMIIREDGTQRAGFIAETSKAKYRTWDMGPAAKGKGKSRKLVHVLLVVFESCYPIVTSFPKHRSFHNTSRRFLRDCDPDRRLCSALSLPEIPCPCEVAGMSCG